LITFNVDGTAYSGIVTGKTTMSGTMISGSATNKWIGTGKNTSFCYLEASEGQPFHP